MKKRILSAVVVLVLFAGVLAGCISGNGTQDAKLNIIDDNYRNYYEIFVGSFYDSDGDGMGDLKGVEEKLDYISDLGCNGIWLMPIMPSPTYHKYDTTDYEAVDEAYGTADDFKELASACHEKGIRLIIDVAMNHSSSQHPWFTQACEYLAGLTAGEDKNTFSYASMKNVEYSDLKRSEKFTPALYQEKDGVWEGGSVSQFTPVMTFRLWERFSETCLEVSESMEVNGKKTFGYDVPVIYKRI